MRTSVLFSLLLVAAVAACGGSKEDEAATRDAAAREAARIALEAEVRDGLLLAGDHARRGDTDRAWAAWRGARALVGETPEVARAADAIRRVERARLHEQDFQRIRTMVTAGADEGEESADLGDLAEAARLFLESYPESEHAEEVGAAREYAEGEIRVLSRYEAALERAREHLGADRYREAALAAGEALAVFTREEPLTIQDRALRALTPEGMVYVPGGAFQSGKDRSPAWLPPFYIDRTEVTNARYLEFVTATGHEPPEHFVDGAPRPGDEEKPVIHVTLGDALAFATWARARIPTEQEWERAARGTDGRAYPWGEEWDEGKGHFGMGGPLPVGGKPHDRSPDGAMDMGGNVMEMTLPLTDPTGKSMGPVMKGGHWSDDLHPEYALTFARYAVDRDHEDAGSGFRCVRTAIR